MLVQKQMSHSYSQELIPFTSHSRRDGRTSSLTAERHLRAVSPQWLRVRDCTFRRAAFVSLT
ncbi:hypothetical protein CDAR_435611, partial [Caerostris darwini]